ncbi:MAG: FAD-dependent oxidoreductase, partial [Silvanigrellaceae bacterium]|nr:FAD-dependent oxidoreductase [Silvanigrellaceae bacterium]
MTKIFFDKFSRTPDYSSNIIEIDNIESNYLIIKMTRPDKFFFESGQHIPIFMKDSQGEFQFCYSIASSAKNKNYLELCVQITGEGRGVKFWKNLTLDDNIYFDKAKGNFKITNLNVPIFLFAGGSGISPVRSILLDIFESDLELKNNIHLIYACKKAEAFSFENELIQLSKKHAS